MEDVTSPPPGWLDRLASHGTATAVVDPDGAHTFAELLDRALAVADTLLGDRADLAGDRVALLCRPGFDFDVALLGVWAAGGIAVPLHPAHPVGELTHPVTDSGATIVVFSPEHEATVDGLDAAAGGLRRVPVGANASTSTTRARDALPTLEAGRPALIIYTSGTTGTPKGAVHTHGSLAAQVAAMVDAWEWSPDDRILLVLPLNHVHGIVNVVLCALSVGATCEAPGGFDATHVWERFASGELTLFMAVPTIYARLVAAWEAASDGDRARWSIGAEQLRLMVSGSAALPVETLDRWERLTGHRLLERYGMTELGMVLGNTLQHRVPGHVGWPFPGVEVRLVEDGVDVAPGMPGELLVRGPQTFAGYWDRPEATAGSFVDGWFLTGDVAVLDEDGYRLLGRSSVDIIKTGGEKVSALEIEEHFRRHPAIHDCAVVGIPDDEWGQRVCLAAIVHPDEEAPSESALRTWAKERIAPAKVPSRVLILEDLPRNAMGKVTKPAVADLFRSPS